MSVENSEDIEVLLDTLAELIEQNRRTEATQVIRTIRAMLAKMDPRTTRAIDELLSRPLDREMAELIRRNIRFNFY